MRRGVIVLNDPNGLSKAMNKMYFQLFPEEVRPTTIITRDNAEIKEFAREQGGHVVLKPLQGSGGQGVFLISLLKAYPRTKGIVADLPGAVMAAEKAISDANLNTRCQASAYDFLEGAPPVCDAYLLVNVLHDWDDETCIRILENISRSMTADSKLWVVEYLLEPGPGQPVQRRKDARAGAGQAGRRYRQAPWRLTRQPHRLAGLQHVPDERYREPALRAQGFEIQPVEQLVETAHVAPAAGHQESRRIIR